MLNKVNAQATDWSLTLRALRPLAPQEIDINKVTPGARVALRNDSYTLHVLLPTKVDPLVSLMKVGGWVGGRRRNSGGRAGGVGWPGPALVR